MPTYTILYYSIEKKTPAFVYICIQDEGGGGPFYDTVIHIVILINLSQFQCIFSR